MKTNKYSIIDELQLVGKIINITGKGCMFYEKQFEDVAIPYS